MSSDLGKRRHPLPLDPGTQAVVNPADVAELAEARREVDRARQHVRRVTGRLRRQLGNAEYGTAGGQIVLRRVQAVTGGGYVRVNHRDDLEVTG
jgi:hypothetical protein